VLDALEPLAAGAAAPEADCRDVAALVDALAPGVDAATARALLRPFV
jgi:hypothetical protein